MSQYPEQFHMSFLDAVWHFRYRLVLYIIGISVLTFIGLYLIGGVPDELKVLDSTATPSSEVATKPNKPQPIRSISTTDSINRQVKSKVTPKQVATQKSSTTIPVPTGDLPVRVIVEKAGINIAVSNPSSRDNNILNNNLLKGAVRYPGSGTPGAGNMFMFGHSSHLRVINNQAFKAFNNLEKLKSGDIVRVQTKGKEYTYSVSSVKLADSDEAFVNLKTNRNMLTLATCNVFGEKQERYIVEADYIGVRTL
jgi:sortase A